MDVLLRTIYSAVEEGIAVVGPSYVSLCLGIPKSSAQSKLIKLAEDGLGTYIPGKGLLFNEKGINEAKKAVKKHRLLEWLMVELGMEASSACKEAAKIENHAGEELVRLLEKKYGPRKVCPCGNRIPEVEG